MGQLVNDIEEVLNSKDVASQAKSERQRIFKEMKELNKEKTNLIKKTLAAQRAKFGASGTGDGMSTDAVLKRLQSETSESYDEKLKNAAEKLRKIKTPKSNILKKFITRMETLFV